MSRQSDPGFDPRVADWLEADPNLAPPDVLRTVESAIPRSHSGGSCACRGGTCP